MKFPALVLIVVILLVLAGCNGVILNATYSQLLDQTTALANESATRAAAGQLTTQQATDIIKAEAVTWQRFRDARDGKASVAP